MNRSILFTSAPVGQVESAPGGRNLPEPSSQQRQVNTCPTIAAGCTCPTSVLLAVVFLILLPATAWAQSPPPLTPDALPLLADASLAGLRIEGPDQVDEETLTLYTVIAEFDNGWEFEVTLDSALWLEPGTNADIGVFGDFDAFDVDGDQLETINAMYSFGPDTETAELDVTIHDLPPAKYALDFDGVDDFVNLGNDASIKLTNGFTLEAWVNLNDVAGKQRVLSNRSESNHGGYGFGVHDGKLLFTLFGIKGYLTTESQVAAGTWAHIAVVFDTLNDVHFYVNGEFVETVTGAESVAPTSQPVYMGRNPAGASADLLQGRIDEVRIWNVECTPEEICQNMHRRLDGDEPGLVGYWRFDEGAGQTAYDSSPNGNNGTLGTNDDPGGDGSDPQWVESDAEMVKGSIVGVEIAGPDEIPSGGQGTYAALASYDEGTVDVTSCVDWSIDPPDAGTFDDPGELTAAEVGNDDVLATITASYDDGTGPQIGEKDITIATLTGPRNALEFDGTDDYVRVPRSPVLEPTDEVTVEAWIRPDSVGPIWSRILRNFGPGGVGYLLAWRNLDTVDYRLQIRVRSHTGEVYVADDVPTQTYLGQWHHVAGVYSASGNFCQIYVDGVLKGSAPGIGPIAYDGVDVHIGNHEPYSNQDFDGAIDEVRIWNVARTQCEIRHNLNRQLRGDEQGLVGYWRFDEGAGQTAHDSSPFGNDGTLGTNDDPGGDPSDPTWTPSAAGLNAPAFPPAYPVPGSPAPDFDNDCDVDQDDLDYFEGCSTGPAIEQTDPDCLIADFDEDTDVDQSDFGTFQRCISGPDSLADPSCAYSPIESEFVALSAADNVLYELSIDPLGAVEIGSLGPVVGDSPSTLSTAGPGLGYTVNRDTDELVTVRLSDATVVSTVPLDADMTSHGRGLDVSPEGVLYGVFAGPQLRIIEHFTGNTSFVADVDLGMIEAIAFGGDGTLYAAGHWSDIAESDRIYTLDLITGEHTFIAALPVSDVDCLAFAPDGYLYGADSRYSSADLYRIDPETGALSNLGSTGILELNGLMVPRRGF